jgi:hypothetical protein
LRVQLKALAALLLVSSAAHADGVIGVRGAYYKERSTRVQQPMVDGAFDTSERGRLSGHFLVDSITSASAATGTIAGEFTELRYEGGLAYVHLLPRHIRVGGHTRVSSESDYLSLFGGVSGEIALFDQSTTVRVLLGHTADSISNGVTVMMGSLGTPRREESLSTNLASIGVSQVLGARMVAGVTYDFIHMDGYQANIYRVVRGGSDPVSERVPDLRLRHAVAASLRAYLPTRTTAIGAYRFYADDWGIVAHTPEVRVVQEIVDGLDLRLRYRYSVQSAADFYKNVYMQSELADPAVYVTDDEKLGEMTTHVVGGQVSVELGLFGLRGLFGEVRIDAVVERILQSTSFGDAWVGQLGLAVPFSY